MGEKKLVMATLSRYNATYFSIKLGGFATLHIYGLILGSNGEVARANERCRDGPLRQIIPSTELALCKERSKCFLNDGRTESSFLLLTRNEMRYELLVQTAQREQLGSSRSASDLCCRGARFEC
jgi:hypothetical protein